MAKAWINEAVAIATLLPDADARAFQVVFQRNGLALIETHLGNLPEALRLVEEGIAHLDRELDADRHRLHRSVLQHNRARVLGALSRLPEALEAYDAVIAADPNYAEYHFDRANLLHRLGRDEEALAGYAAAIRLSPPFPEVYYNRADVALGLGDVDAALADLTYLLDLDPTYVDAYANRAGALVARGDLGGARRDVDAGLALAGDHAHLHAVSGQLYAEAGQVAEAEVAYRRAIELDASLAAAWAGLAALAYEAGDASCAVEHLTRALAQGEDAALRYNRAVAYRSAGRYADALADLDEALRADPGDEDVLGERAACLADAAVSIVDSR